MDQTAAKFFSLHASLAEVVKKLMKNGNCKELVLKWMRHAVDLNLEKDKMVAHKPVATNGFFLNYLDLLLQLCKPFTVNSEKYANFLPKINCFYLLSSSVLLKPEKFDLMVGGDNLKRIKRFIDGNADPGLQFSGVTMDPLIREASSLMDEDDQDAAKI